MVVQFPVYLRNSSNRAVARSFVAYLANRVALLILTLFLVSVIAFSITNLLPGNVAKMPIAETPAETTAANHVARPGRSA